MIAGYLARETFLHRMSAKAKLAGLVLFGIGFTFVSSLWISAALLALILAFYVFCGPEALRRLAGLRMLLLFLLMIGLFQGLTVSWQAGANAVIRLMVMVLLADLVTLSTTMQDMMAALLPLLRPFERFGLNPQRVALAVALVLRFIPYLVANWRERDEAYRARTGKRGGWRIVAPFIVETMQLADRVAETLDARGFNMERDRT